MIESAPRDGSAAPRSPVFSLHADGIEVLWAQFDESDGNRTAWAALLSSEERKRAARFKFERDRGWYLWRRTLLRLMLAERLHCRPETIEYALGPNGKPCLGGRFRRSTVRFNLAHSNGLVALAFTEGSEVGVDVERIQPLPGLDALARGCFTASERHAWLDLDSADRTDLFFMVWTRKEALLKAFGTGLMIEPNRVQVWEAGDRKEGHRNVKVMPDRLKRLDIQDPSANPPKPRPAGAKDGEGCSGRVVTDPAGGQWRLCSFQPRVGWWGSVSTGR
jgi:4'-phosphopantetheinyl transferase